MRAIQTKTHVTSALFQRFWVTFQHVWAPFQHHLSAHFGSANSARMKKYTTVAAAALNAAARFSYIDD
jgi:hypothetical protein